MLASFKREALEDKASSSHAEDPGDLSSETQYEGGDSSPESSSPQQVPLPSGLSALIQAATCQLDELADAASHQSHIDEPADDSHTPPSVQEIHPQSFPERLMTLCLDPQNSDTITFLPDGKFFAIRRSKFEEQKFFQQPWNDFLDLLESWGFTCIYSDGIAVLRHPNFIKTDYNRCRRIQFGDTPRQVRMFSVPKRRLSPNYCRHDSVESMSSKLRVNEDSTMMNQTSSDDKAKLSHSRVPSINLEEDSVRSLALSITAEKLKMEDTKDGLVASAVTSATNTIVTDAIVTLLRDSSHSKETYLKHEEELSKSSLPGVIPISKQLFSPNSKPLATKISPTISPNNVPSRKDIQSPSRIVTNDPEEEDDSKLPPSTNGSIKLVDTVPPRKETK
jgi:hypothetical protein